MDTSNGIQKRDSSIGPKRIVFFHPDLGLGGAERLVIDAAVGLQNLGHKVTVFTSHCDRSHCFEEVKDGECFYFGCVRLFREGMIVDFRIVIFRHTRR